MTVAEAGWVFIAAILLIVVAAGALLVWSGRETRQSVRATLTLLPDGSMIVGSPATVTPELAAVLRDRLEAWREHRGLLVLPWPVDVRDFRKGTPPTNPTLATR